MKRVLLFLALVLAMVPGLPKTQSQNKIIVYYYDNAGNRILRESFINNLQNTPETPIKNSMILPQVAKISPNPTHDVAKIELLNIESNNAKLYSMLGMYLKTIDIQNGFGEIDLSKYPIGVYVVHIIDNETNVHILKVVKQ